MHEINLAQMMVLAYPVRLPETLLNPQALSTAVSASPKQGLDTDTGLIGKTEDRLEHRKKRPVIVLRSTFRLIRPTVLL
jgi:hypothetical protein